MRLNKEDLKFLDSIEGWMSFEECKTLFNLVCESPGKMVVEVGSWKGRSTAWLWLACDLIGKKLCTIDHFKGSSEHQKMYGGNVDTFLQFRNNMRAVQRRFNLKRPITVIKERSLDAVERFDDSTIGMVFIDASHEYKHIKKDIEIWTPKVTMPNGIIALHDTYFVGVNQAIQELNLGPMWNINDSILSFRRWIL